MKLYLVSALAFFCVVGTVFSEPSEKEIVALMNRVQRRIAEGDVKALDDLTALPAKFSTSAFLTIFKQNYNVSGASASQKAIGLRCAQLATSTPGGEEYLAKLLKGKAANNYIYFQQESAIHCLTLVHNDVSIRILCGALDDLDPEEIGPKVVRALASLNLAAAPVSPKETIRYADAISKWKQWWDAHKSEYASKATPSVP